MYIITNYANGTATSFLEGIENGWTLGTVAGAPGFPLLATGTTGAMHFVVLPGASGVNCEMFLLNATDLNNTGSVRIGVLSGTAFVQSQVQGTGTAVTSHEFGEPVGQSSLATWKINFGGVTKFLVTPASTTAPSLVTTPCTVATLPATPVAGQRAFVTDSNAASYTAGIGTVVATGGSTAVPVVFDGTSWRIG
jgi:hypothetical protein